MTPIFSIIIPHKNIPELLQRCLDSIPQRDDIQIIIVDDNSDPNIVDFDHFPGLNESNIEVYFDKSNKGAGRARNIGLEHAKGRWILFSDCDDYYNTNNLMELFDSNIPNRCNLVIWGIRHINFDGSIWEDFVEENMVISFITDKKLLLNRFAPWRAMIRNTIIKKNYLKFEEIPASNDVMFHTRLMGCIATEEIMWFPKTIYNWVQRCGSITHQQSLSKSISRFRASLRANRYALNQKWGLIDGTRYYLGEIKKTSNFQFFFAYYWEWFYIGWRHASNDYYAVYKTSGERSIALLLHPSMILKIFLGKLRSKLISKLKRTN